MKAVQLLKLLEEHKLEEAKQVLKEEIMLEKSSNKSVDKAIIDLSKHCFKKFKDMKPGLAGAVHINLRTYMTDSYMALRVNDIVEGLTMVNSKLANNYPTKGLNMLIDTTQIDRPIIITKNDITKWNNEFKIAKTKKEKYFVKFEGMTDYKFDYEVLKKLLECFDLNIETTFELTRHNALIIKNDKASGILLPCKED